MPAAGSVTSVGGRRWVRAALCLIAGGILAWTGFTLALVNVAALPKPQLALRFSSTNPVAIAKRMDDRLSAGPPFPSADSVRQSALESLRGQLINERAIRLLAFASDLKRDRQGALGLINTAQRLSRRDLRSRLWMIEYFAGTGNADAALAQYDLALRTSSVAPQVLFPVLASALADESLWPPFAKYLKSRPNWVPQFLTYAIREGQHPEAIAKLLLRYGGPDLPEMDAVLLGRLVLANQDKVATAYYLSRPGAARSTLTTLALNNENTNPRYIPITWNLFPRAEMDSALVDGDGRNRRSISTHADAGASGIVGRKFLTLAPGTYRVAITPAQVAKEDAYVGWELVCATTGDKISSSGGARNDRLLTVPADCPAQYFDLLVSNAGRDESLELTIDDVALKQVG